MFYNTFKDFESALSVFIDQEDYDEALALLKNAQDLLPTHEYEENYFLIMFLIIRIYTIQLKADECISMIKSAISQDISFPLDFKRFDFIRQHEDYHIVRQANEAILAVEKKNSSFKYKVYLPETYDANKKHPLFICLHGDGPDGYISYHSSYWKPDVFLQRGYIVVYPQSSQLYCYNSFGWLPDPILTRQEIKNCCQQLLKDYSVDEAQVIIGGFSGGANASLDIALSNTIRVKGFIALCPSNDLSPFIAAANSTASSGIKGVILEGQQDTDEVVPDMLKAFREVELPYKYILNENIGHSYPEDLDRKLVESIEFIAG